MHDVEGSRRTHKEPGRKAPRIVLSQRFLCVALWQAPGALHVDKFEEMKGDNHAVSSGGLTGTKEMLPSVALEGTA